MVTSCCKARKELLRLIPQLELVVMGNCFPSDSQLGVKRACFFAFWVAFIMVFDRHILPQCHTAWWQLSFCGAIVSCPLRRLVVSVFKGRAGAVSYFNRGSQGHGDVPCRCLQGRALWLRPAQDQPGQGRSPGRGAGLRHVPRA